MIKYYIIWRFFFYSLSLKC